jgi:CheY-like chemotaxis protein
MKTLIAEDDSTTRLLLEITLTDWGFEALTVNDGEQAWQRLQADESINLVLLDWNMPGLSGVDVCRNVRQRANQRTVYIILVTARRDKEDVVAGLQAGADDYITKPFASEELHARVMVGVRIVQLQQALAARVQELEQALSRVKLLQGLLPICGYCKKIRDDQNYWQHLESYISAHSEAQFSHGVCPDCFERVVRPELDAIGASGPTPPPDRPPEAPNGPDT